MDRPFPRGSDERPRRRRGVGSGSDVRMPASKDCGRRACPTDHPLPDAFDQRSANEEAVVDNARGQTHIGQRVALDGNGSIAGLAPVR